MWGQPPPGCPRREAPMVLIVVIKKLKGDGFSAFEHVHFPTQESVATSSRRASLARTAEGGCPHIPTETSICD
jgi:hypothetical protein